MTQAKIGNRFVGDGHAIYIMADLGLTNGGDLSRAKELINTSRDLGVDAVKFQMIDAEKLLGDHSIEYTYPTLKEGSKTENMLEMFKKLEFTDEEWHSLKQTADECEVDMIVTSHYEGAVERVNKLDLKVNKICTWSLNHRRMIEMLAKNGKPLLFDTGTITRLDLLKLDDVYKKAGGGSLILLHDFHTDDEMEMNFNAFDVYRQLGIVAGYTPQGRSDWLDFMSVGLGASILEKRLTLSRLTPENGHWKAHEPDEFADWMEKIRKCERALGERIVQPTTKDMLDSEKYYKSAYLLRNVNKGDIIRQIDLEFKRPGCGISSWDVTEKYVGLSYAQDFKAGDMLKIR